MWPALLLLAGKHYLIAGKRIARSRHTSAVDCRLDRLLSARSSDTGTQSHKVQPPLLSFALFLSHPEISVLDPLHLDSADDLNFGATFDRGDRDSADARDSQGSYEAVFGPDVNIEYAGINRLIECSPYRFCIFFPFCTMQNH